MRVPINFVTTPGIDLTSACFSDDLYVVDSAQECFSNLLAIGFRRFVVDLYWDTSRLSWSLCPVELSSGGANPSTSRSSLNLTTSSEATSASAKITTGTLPSSNEVNQGKVPSSAVLGEFQTTAVVLRPRQTDASSIELTVSSLPVANSDSATSTTSSPTPSTTVDGIDPTSTSDGAGTLVQVGPYTCDPSFDLSNITGVLADHLHETENSLNATLKYLIFNLHVAAPHDNPTASPVSVGESFLPDSGNYVGELVNSSLSSYIYTPVALEKQRANLNASWFTVDYDDRPLTSYLDIDSRDDGTTYSSGGWPSESFIELQRGLRLLAGFGTIDEELKNYNFAADADTIFPQGYLANPASVTLAADGVVADGCLFQTNVTSLSAVNSSWAVANSDLGTADINLSSATAGNLTSCGISPILNATLAQTANVNISLYRDFIQRQVWSWASGEPRSYDTSSDSFRCATVSLRNGGKWQVSDCSDKHYGACRIAGAPYEWTVTNQTGGFGKMDDSCGDDTFSVPLTAMENSYLRDSIRLWTGSHDDDDNSDLFWVNLNDLDMSGCWVRGINSTCPYARDTTRSTRTVVVPVVAAVIIFVIALSMIFIKCAANRQNSKRRRKNVGGWDYEGVPS